MHLSVTACLKGEMGSMNLGTPEILLILLVIVIFFGPKKIPELAKGLGKGLREFRKAARDVQDEIENEIKQGDDKEEPKK